MLKYLQPCGLMSPIPTSERTLMGFKYGIHVVGNGCLLKSMAISAFRTSQAFKPNYEKIMNKKNKVGSRLIVQASLIKQPFILAGRVCLMYVVFKLGSVGHGDNFSSDGEGGNWMPKWLKDLLPVDSETRAANERRKLVSKWHVTTKGILKRSYRIPMVSEGRRLLKAIASLLADDDTFTDASCHKGCQIRRENAHAESVCCKNVRALFDELPTPHMVVEIIAFPAGPLSESDYFKAEKIEKVLRTGATI